MIGGRSGWLVMLAGLVLAAGCSGESTPATPIPASPAETLVTAETTPTVAPPAAPEAKRDAAGAEAFVRYFWEIYNYSYETLNPGLFEAISDPDCDFCTSAITEIETFKAVATSKEGGAVAVTSLSVPQVEKPERILVASVLSQSAGRTVTRSGDTETIPAIDRASGLIGLEWTENSWRVHGVSIEAE